jgi:hypothetical protein
MTHDDDFLRGKAREAIEARTLPNLAPDQVWGGPGTGARCAICGVSTTHADIELEIEFADDGYAGPSSHFVHLRCFSVFELERQKLAGGALSARTAGGANGSDPINDGRARHDGS